jgi:hypothetical protein
MIRKLFQSVLCMILSPLLAAQQAAQPLQPQSSVPTASSTTAVRPQALPDAPAPRDPAWDRLKNLAIGAPIVVRDVDDVSVRCLFAGMTDAYLFCNPAGNPSGVGYRFDRDRVLSVDFDRPGRNNAQFAASERNYHPGWIASILAGGLIVGVCATRTTDTGTAAKAGLVGAVVVGIIGVPLAFLPHPQDANSAPRPQPFFGLRFPLVALHPRLPARTAGAGRGL